MEILYFKHYLLAIFLVCAHVAFGVEQEYSKLRENIELMNRAPANACGMDVIIICSSTPALASFWQARLEETRSDLLHKDTLIVSVDEDWAKGGAGNGLGTLYAFRKAHIKAKEELGIDLLQLQAAGASIAMYHTAGLGKRLAPLTISKAGVKSAVELPGLIRPPSNDDEPLRLFTLLEATIKQTLVYGPSRKGRLSVFWSDQVFIPSNSCAYTPDSHIDILVKTISFPTKEKWEEQGLQNYGLVAWDGRGEAKLFDKCSYDTFQGICADNKAISDKGVAISMGTFSLSTPMLKALLVEFKDELAAKKILYDSDPYFWMPLTLDLETYEQAMQARQIPVTSIHAHYARMQRFKTQFLEQTPGSHLNFFAGVDIGSESVWWDYGTVDAYYNNNLAMTQEGINGELMRSFYNVTLSEGDSIMIGCHIDQAAIKNSILIGVSGNHVEAENTIFINGDVNRIKAQNALLYCLTDDSDQSVFNDKDVRADFITPKEKKHLKFMSKIDSDGKLQWKTRLPQNPYSWEQATELGLGEIESKGG